MRAIRWWVPAAAAAAAVVVGAAVMWGGSSSSRPPVEASALRLTLAGPDETTEQHGGALSRDGRSLVSVAEREGQGPALWLTDLQSGRTRLMPGTAGATRPFWSPDGTAVGFFADGRLRTVAVAGGTTRALVPVRYGNGGSWTSDDHILFADLRSAILIVPASGGSPTPVTTVDSSKQEVAHLAPQILPDGRHFLYFIQGSTPDASGTFVGALDAQDKTRVLDEQAVYASGMLLFVRNRVLFAQPFDLKSSRLTGEPAMLDGNVAPFDVIVGDRPSPSDTGLLAYHRDEGPEQFAWFDRRGNRLDVIETPGLLYNPRLSVGNDQLMAASREGSGPGAIWAIDLSRGAPTRIAEGMRPVASPDGTEVAFTSDQETGVADIYLRPLDRAEGNELLVRSDENKMVDDWTRDGRTVVFASTNAATKADIWTVPLAGEREPTPFLQTPFNEFQARLSPDGRWIAYTSDEAGAYEVYLQSFPAPGDKLTVSVGGGTEPHWRADGRELFYLAPDGAVMAVSVQPGPRARFRLGRPEKLFRVPQLRSRGLYINNYDVSDDGQRFLMTAPRTGGHASPLTLIVNWRALITTR